MGNSNANEIMLDVESTSSDSDDETTPLQLLGESIPGYGKLPNSRCVAAAKERAVAAEKKKDKKKKSKKKKSKKEAKEL